MLRAIVADLARASGPPRRRPRAGPKLSTARGGDGAARALGRAAACARAPRGASTPRRAHVLGREPAREDEERHEAHARRAPSTPRCTTSS
jgi:hypothetical protein